MKLILDYIRQQSPDLTANQITPILMDIGQKTLKAEESYLLDAVDRIAEDRQYKFEDQLESRLESLDTFLEGLSYGSEEPVNPQEVFNQLRDLVRTRFELNPQQIKELVENPGDELKVELQNQIETQLKAVEYRRLVGGVERLLGSPLEGEIELPETQGWSDIKQLMRDKIGALFSARKKSYFTDPEGPKVLNSVENGLKNLSKEHLSDTDIIQLLGLMAEGRQAAFDKKSHQRIWLRTQRLRFTFFAADLLWDILPENLPARIIDHLEDARVKLEFAWGENELLRLKDSAFSQLEEKIQLQFKDHHVDLQSQNISDTRIADLTDPIRSTLKEILGKTTLSNIYRELFLRVISELWVEYLTEMEALRVAIGLEAYAQRDPLVQYKSRGFEMFQRLMDDMQVGVVNRMFTFQPRDLSMVQTRTENQPPPTTSG
jgi:preprotein translocase subunit SecA